MGSNRTKLFIIVSVCFLLFNSLSVYSSGQSDDWPMFAHDVERSGLSPDATLQPPLVQKWVFNPGISGVSQGIAIIGNSVYVGIGNNLYALNATTGSTTWSYIGGGTFESNFGVANGVIYAGASDNMLYAIDTGTGNLISQYTTGGNVRGAPTAVNGIVYFTSWDGNMYAANTSNLSPIWSYNVNGGNPVESGPAIVNNMVYVGGGDYLWAFDASTGALLWNQNLGSIVDSEPAYANGLVFSGSQTGIYALGTSAGNIVWSQQIGVVNYPPVISGDTVFAVANNGNVYALVLSTGSTIWEQNIPAGFGGYIVGANGYLYIDTGSGGGFVTIKMSDGSYLGETLGPNNVSAIANGMYFETSSNGTVYALVSQTPPPTAGFYAVPTSGVAPLHVQFTDTSANNPTNWFWGFGDGGISTSESPGYTYYTPGTFTVQLIVSNSYGTSTDIQTNYIYVSNTVELAPLAGFYAVPTSGVVPLQVQFTDTSANNPTSWKWNFGDGGTSTVENPSYSYNSAGSFTVQLIVSNANGTSTAIIPNYIYTIAATGGTPPALSNPPALKAFIGVGLTTVFNLEDYNNGGLGTSYSIPMNFLSLGTTVGSYVSETIYDTATTGTNTYEISNGGGSSSASGLVKYSTYRIRKLPHVGLTPGSSWDVNVASYTYNSTGLAIPPSFYNPAAISVSDTTLVSATWVGATVIHLTSLQSFSNPVEVDVIASPNATNFGSDIDKERILVYTNLLSNSTFSTANDTTFWSPLEVAPGRTNLATQTWIPSYTDSAGIQADGVWQFIFADTTGGVKCTPTISNWITISNGQWYTFRMRLVADSTNNNHQAYLYGFTNFVGEGIQTDIAANISFGVPTVWTWQEAPLLAHGNSAAGYPQFQLKAGGAGSIYIDEIQILNAAPALLQARSNTHFHYFYGQFTTGNDTTGWGQQLYADASSAPAISVDSGLVLNFLGASSTSLEGIKWTANNGVQGPLHAYSFPVNPNYDVNIGLTLSIQSGSFNSVGIILAAAYGIQTAGQQDIGIPPSSLIAVAGVGILNSGNYYAEGNAVNPYYQGQFGVRSDLPGTLTVSDVDINVDHDDPNFGDATLFP